MNIVIGSLAFGQSFDGIKSGKSNGLSLDSRMAAYIPVNQVRNMLGFPLWSRASEWGPWQIASRGFLSLGTYSRPRFQDFSKSLSKTRGDTRHIPWTWYRSQLPFPSHIEMLES